MNELRLLFALLLPTIVGFLFAFLLMKDDKKIGVFERVFLGYGLGMGIVIYSMFISGIFGIRYTFFNMVTLQMLIIFIILAVLIYLKIPFLSLFHPLLVKESYEDKSRWKYIGMGVLAMLLLWKVSFVLYEGLTRPIFSWDIWANWGAGAKFIFYEKGLNLDSSSEFFFGRGYRVYLGYPLHNPLLQAWVSIFLGEFHEVYAKAWAPFYFISLLGMFFFAVKRETSLWIAFIATFLLSSAPLVTYHAIDAYSDLPMGYYAFAGVAMLWRYMKTGGKDLLSLCGILMGMGLLTKNEGMFFIAAVTILLGIFIFFEKRKDKSDMLCFLIPLGVVIGPWVLFKLAYGIGYGQGMPLQFIKSDIVISAVKEFARVLFMEANFNIIFAFLFVMVILNIRTLFKEDTKYLFIIITIVASMFFFLYMTTHYEYLVTGTVANRNLLTYIPIAYFLASILAFRLWYNKKVI